jgi:ornithine cyclodeaminase/alanine dehydrogenase-like protein (mu-crystallin family)
MKLLVLSAADVHATLGSGDCVAAVRAGLTALATGRAQQPLRVVIRSAAAPGLVALMPAYLPAGADAEIDAGIDADAAAVPVGSAGPGAYGLKALCITPGNPAAGLDTHQGLVLLSDAQTGEPLAILNASAVTEIRTAAVSVLATEALARPGAADLAVIGTGVQARAHVLAFDQARKLRRVRVAGRDQAKAAAFAASLRDQVAAGITVSPSVQEAVAGADIIVTATSSAQPVLRREWISPGAHINAVGACMPTDRELDSATVAGSALFADSRESLTTESGDYLLAVADGQASPASIRAELGDVLTGAAPGRISDTEITIFESLGLAIEDLAAALAAYQNAAATAAGHWLDF